MNEPNDKPELLPMAESCCGSASPRSVPCCGPATVERIDFQNDKFWRDGFVATPIGQIPRITTRLTWRDRLGHWKVRWGIGRMRYAVAPGLYAVGHPAPESPVFVTANFKMSFDRLRAALEGRDGWILVLDTRGINVWCAAGKGTFGTGELIGRVLSTRLADVVSHRKLIVPQLGAPGIAAHEVRMATGFTVRYGPVRADDLPPFLDSGFKASAEMRRVRFPLRSRLALSPVELIEWGKWGLIVSAGLGLLAGFGAGIFSIERALWFFVKAVVPIVGGLVAGTVLAPMLLPWLPGRSFAAKGAWAGVIYVIALAALGTMFSLGVSGWVEWVATILLALAVASFAAMNFTGASTYTSLSGVRKEMRAAVPIQTVTALIGLGFWLAGRWV